ncbi:monomeric [FeFe] hydrogenase [Pontiella agarivorans]|uniref:Monomeric [FeFe] hydrogenase n=1 Tax=Pontiella agarivorans TaxID=3038953 RepID=A0ABU5MU33_9BACT|nr:monomeric [FeFe] hydrogenase [Pontiella agarivorans]MDZ8117717.1 monomeric [FeFe] hydrogenase [Pontiella agarivorans]
MFHDNKANRLRKEILARVARAFFADQPADTINRIPISMRLKGARNASRCCIYKDRAVLKYRTMAALGYSVENETDELKPISAYFENALRRTEAADPVLTVIDVACSACVTTQYSATNACKGCLARSCETVCPKKAIEFREGKAWLNPEKCVNCGLCMKACPYHAIIHIPIPCEEACPVGAITKDPETGRELIDRTKCTYCGKCLRECPFAAITDLSQMIDVLKALQSRHAVAMIAPSVAGQLPGTLPQLITALKTIGFSDVVEVAAGADQTALHESAEWLERTTGGEAFMTTSCCPAYIETVEKHLPELKPYVSDTPTPMAYTAANVRKKDPEAITVFIGPCIAKRVEARKNPDVDFVLTFEELGAMLVGAEVDVLECEAASFSAEPSREGRGFAASRGVTKAVEAALPDCRRLMKPVQVDGIDRKSLLRMKQWSSGTCPGNFVEVMSCEGGCIAGPGTIGNPRIALKELARLCDESPTMTDRRTDEPVSI